MSPTKVNSKWALSLSMRASLCVVSPPVIYPVLLKAVWVWVLSPSSDLHTLADAQEKAVWHPCTNPDQKHMPYTHLHKYKFISQTQTKRKRETFNFSYTWFKWSKQGSPLPKEYSVGPCRRFLWLYPRSPLTPTNTHTYKHITRKRHRHRTLLLVNICASKCTNYTK